MKAPREPKGKGRKAAAAAAAPDRPLAIVAWCSETRLRAWSWLIPVALSAFVWLSPSDAETDFRDFEEPLAAVGYNEVVEHIFVPLNWLVRNDPAPDGRGAPPVVSLSARARTIPEVIRFVHTSFLSDDIAADDPKRWRFDGNRVTGVDPWIHGTTGPLAERRGWRGDIHYRNPRQAEVAIESDTQRLVLATASEQLPVDWEVAIDGETQAGGRARHAVRFSDGAWIALVQRIGANVVVTAERNHPRIRALVLDPGGRAQGHDSADATTYVMRPGSRLVFRRRGEETDVGAAFRLSGGALPASQYRPFGARLYDPVAEPLTRPLSAALAAVSRRNPTIADRSIPLTLDAEVQADAQNRLDARAAELRRAIGHPFRAAVTIMDATNGDLLALASYPTRTSEQGTARPAPAAWTEQNQNFVALPIGSVAKVPFAAAILTRYPQLQSLVVDSSPAGPGGGFPFTSVAGVGFGVAINDTVGRAGIDFGTFIEQSSNRYAATLMMLAAGTAGPLAEDGFPLPPGDEYALDGRRRSRAPRLAFGCQETVGRFCRAYAGTGNFLSQLPAADSESGGATWVTLFGRVFDLPRAASATGGLAYDTRIWAPLLSTWSRDTQRHFSSLSPESESFGLNRIENIRNDYLSLVIGGGRSRWTNVKVAEALARIVMDRAVSARLVMPLDDDQPQHLLPSGIGEVAVNQLRAGMRRAHLTGTASAIVPGFAAPAGYELRIFAKTGTPTVASADRSPLNAEIQALIDLGIVGIGGGEFGLIGRQSGESEAAALSRLRRDRVAQANVPEERLLSQIRSIARERRRGGSAGLQFADDGRLAGIAPDIADPLSDRGGTVAFVLGLYRSGQADGQPLRALSIAINVQARTRSGGELGTNPALQLAAALLRGEGAIARWLLRAPLPSQSPFAGETQP